MSTDPRELIRRLARRFHESYERLAPSFGYETRKESAVPWEQVPEQNRELMEAACEDALAPLADMVELLQRLRQWDYMNTPSSDGPYWKGEIDVALAKLEKLT